MKITVILCQTEQIFLFTEISGSVGKTTSKLILNPSCTESKMFSLYNVQNFPLSINYIKM